MWKFLKQIIFELLSTKTNIGFNFFLKSSEPTVTLTESSSTKKRTKIFGPIILFLFYYYFIIYIIMSLKQHLPQP